MVLLLSGCTQPVDRELSFLPIEHVDSVTYSSWFLGKMEISMTEDTCMIKVDDYTYYIDFDGTYYYAVHPYEDSYIGLDYGDTEFFCDEFLLYDQVTTEPTYNPVLRYNSIKGIYESKKEDGIKVTAKADDNGYFTYYLVEDDDLGVIVEYSNFNEVEFEIPSYQIEKSYNVILEDYPDLSYNLEEEELTTSNGVWTAVIDFDIREITFTREDTEYTFFSNNETYLNSLEAELFTLDALILEDASVDEEFFALISEILMKERNITEHFGMPDPEIKYQAPSAG